MKILLLTSEFAPATGGVGTYAREIATAAARLGGDVTIVAPDYGDADAARADRTAPFRVRRFRGGPHSARDLPNKVRLAHAIVGADQHEVVHAVDWPFFLPLALARRRTSARLVLSVHGPEIDEMQTAARRLAVRLTGAFGPRAEVVANSDSTRDLFLSRFDMRPARVRTIPPGVSEFWFGPRADRDVVRRKYVLDPDALVMVTLGQITRRKGHLASLAALRLLPEPLRRRITWLIVGLDGEPDYVAELHTAVAAAGCDIRFLGRLPDTDIRDVFGAADFFCVTGMPDPAGRVEGFGLTYLEAGACDLPSIATDIGGVGEAVIAGRSGLLVEPEPAAIARAIGELATDEPRRVALGRGALAHARALNWERCAAAIYGLCPGDDILLPPVDRERVAIAPLGVAEGEPAPAGWRGEER